MQDSWGVFVDFYGLSCLRLLWLVLLEFKKTCLCDLCLRTATCDFSTICYLIWIDGTSGTGLFSSLRRFLRLEYNTIFLDHTLRSGGVLCVLSILQHDRLSLFFELRFYL